MAGVSTKEIKNRIKSMESTRQITKAMEMVASSKLRRAQAQVLNSRPYFEILSDTIQDIVNSEQDFTSPYLQERPIKRTLYVTIAGDRGLAGGYNSNVLKLVQELSAGQDALMLPIGKKAVDYFKSHNIPTYTDSYAVAADISIGDCFSVAKQLSKGYLNGEFDEIYVVYTRFISILSQNPASQRLLPLAPAEKQSSGTSVEYEPNCEAVFEAIVPEYLGGVLYGALCESRVSEQAARRTAMESATSNADDMIADLSLKFNRARQAAITNEIIDIVAGS